MWRSICKVVAASLLFGGVHSLLASRAAKKRAVQLLGERRRNALYRPFYNAQAVATFGALVVYCMRLRDRELYRAPRPLARLMQASQLALLLYLLWGARQIGFLRFGGAPNLLAWLKDSAHVPREPEAQGPAPDESARLRVAGPFRDMRHPLNFTMIPVMWLMPRMTVNLAAFNVVMTLYLVLGSVHEEKRLREAYGSDYAAYQRRVPFMALPLRGNLKASPSAHEPYEEEGGSRTSSRTAS